MKIIETINNAFDTVRSIEGILREARTYSDEANGRGTLSTALKENEQLNVQLVGCLIAAEGGTSDAVVALPGDYGWSVAYQKVLLLAQRLDELEIENRKLLDQNWSLVEERDAEIVKRDALQVELATLRAKSEPVASSIGEPDYGVGFGQCPKDEAVDACVLLDIGGKRAWSSWGDMSCWVFNAKPNEYRFRRPIAKPAVEAEPQWVACTADEARTNPAASQCLAQEIWETCANWERTFQGACSYRSEFPYKTTAQLSEWVTVSIDAWRDIVTRDPMIIRDVETRRILRSKIPVGTVLG